MSLTIVERVERGMTVQERYKTQIQGCKTLIGKRSSFANERITVPYSNPINPKVKRKFILSQVKEILLLKGEFELNSTLG